jgi:hypothetical protein
MILVPALFVGATLVLASCASQSSGPEDGSTIPRQLFVQTYVELRVAALTGTTPEITPVERERILTQAGVTEEDLLRFVEVWGSDVQLMKEVWEEVDSVLQARREEGQRHQ